MGKAPPNPGRRAAIAAGVTPEYIAYHGRAAGRMSREIRLVSRKIYAMHAPRALILRAPGANCDAELQFAFERAGAVAEKIHVNRLRENPDLLHRFQILAIPGGFSYGDDV